MSFNTNHVTQFFGQATRRVILAGLSGTLALSLAACGSPEPLTTGATAGQTSEATSDATKTTEDAATTSSQDEQQAQDEQQESAVDIASFSIDTSGLFSKRDLDSSYDEASATKVTLADAGSKAEGDGVTVDGSTVTISAEGTYVISGTLSDGRVVVDVEDGQKVQLVLKDAQVTSSTGTALYVRNADKVFVTLADSSSNVLASTGAATEEDDHTLDGTLFSADDLTINGAGELKVTSANGHGVVGKDEVTLVSGTLDIDAAKSGIQGKDSVAVKDGSYAITAGTDGIHAEHESNGAKGFVYVAGGTFDLEVQKDGIDASNDVLIDGGTFAIAAGDDGIHSEYDLTVNDGTIRVNKSYESLEGATVTVAGGDIDVAASDDGVNATGVPSSTNTDDTPTKDGGQMPEGGEVPRDMQAPDGGQMPQDGPMPQDGQMPQDGPMPQDGQMPGGGRPGGRSSGFGEGNGDGFSNGHMGGGGGDFENDPTASVTISGGKLVITSGGDGIDSNGSLTVSGGQTYVNGPTSDGDGALDCAGEATVTGGTFLALGSSGMAQGFGSNSTQGSMLVSAEGSKDDLIELKDAAGNVLVSHTALKDYSCVVISAPGIEQGNAYTLTYGSGSKEITMDAASFSDVTAGMGGAKMMGGGKGQMAQAPVRDDTTAA